MLLDEVLHHRRPLDSAFDRIVTPLAPRDRAFARALAATVLRRLGQIDALLDGFLERPLVKRNRWVRQVLRLGAAQLLFLGTPAHAAVASAVEQAAESGPLKGLVNAVLRRVADDGAAGVAAQDAPRLNTPEWLWGSWSDAYGEVRARAIADAHLIEPPLDLTAKDDDARWAHHLNARSLPWGTLRLDRAGRIEDLRGYAQGAWWVQDAAAALPGKLLMDAVKVAGRRTLDLCAAPGGKAAQLAAAGALVTAIDRSAVRTKRLRANLGRLDLTAETVVADAVGWRATEPYEAVLLDAPCSSTGTIRRHPDIPHLKVPTEVERMCALQDGLLTTAAAALAPGGVLVYCVCSLQPEECEARIERLLSADSGLARIEIRANEVGGRPELINVAGDLRTLPCHLQEHGGIDGFYAARLRRER